MQENYVNLCTFNFGKRTYIIMKGNKVKYFEQLDGKYQIPIHSFNLYDNEGKSLTYVNQHFFMNQLVEMTNNYIKKGYLVTNEEISNYLNEIIIKVNNDSNFKNILKGTFMSEINEPNFETNKKRIIDYLKEFEIKNYIDYNNVSIFNGSINKNENVQIEKITENQNTLNNQKNEENSFDFGSNKFTTNDDLLNNKEYLNINENIVKSDEKVKNILENISNEKEDNSSISFEEAFPKSNIDDKQEIPSEQNINTISDDNVFTFNDIYSINNEIQNNEQIEQPLNPFENNIQVQEPIQMPQMETPNDNVEINNAQVGQQVNLFENSVQVQEPIQMPQTETTNNNVEINNLQVDQAINPFENNIQVQEPIQMPQIETPNNNMEINNEQTEQQNNLFNNIDANNSYIKQVQDRIMTKSPEFNAIKNTNIQTFNNEIATETNFKVNEIDENTVFQNNVINDKDNLKNLEDMTVNMPAVTLENETVQTSAPKEKKKNHVLLIVFIILIVIALAMVALYFLI